MSRRPWHRVLSAALVATGTAAAALVLLIGVAGSAPAAGAGTVVARSGSITVTATRLHPGPNGSLTSQVQVTTSAPASDELDAALVAGSGAVTIYHQRVSVGELTELASCDGQTPPPGLVDRWLHEGPMVVPGRSSGSHAPADATLTVPGPGPGPVPPRVVVTLYFVHAGPVVLSLPSGGSDR